MHWDEAQAARRASAALGWQATFDTTADADLLGNRAITLMLTNRDGEPIKGAAIELVASHRGQAADVQDIRLKQSEPGVYAGVLQVKKFGQWQFNGAAKLGQNCFLIDQRVWVE